MRARDIGMAQLVDALGEVLPRMNDVTLDLTVDALSEFFHVPAQDIKRYHRSFLLEHIPYLCKTMSDSDDSSGPSGASAPAPACTQRADEEKEQEATEGRLVVVKQRPRARAKPAVAASSTTPPKKRRAAARGPQSAERTGTGEPKATTRANRQTASPRELTNLTEVARVAGLLSPRSKLSRKLKNSDNTGDKSQMLRAALKERGFQFKGKYPTKVEISVAKVEKERQRELDGIDVSNVLPDHMEPRYKRTRRLDFGGETGEEAGDDLAHILSDGEEKEADSEVSAPSITALSD